VHVLASERGTPQVRKQARKHRRYHSISVVPTMIQLVVLDDHLPRQALDKHKQALADKQEGVLGVCNSAGGDDIINVLH
jgi:hypothetical protein